MQSSITTSVLPPDYLYYVLATSVPVKVLPVVQLDHSMATPTGKHPGLIAGQTHSTINY